MWRRSQTETCNLHLSAAPTDQSSRTKLLKTKSFKPWAQTCILPWTQKDWKCSPGTDSQGVPPVLCPWGGIAAWSAPALYILREKFLEDGNGVFKWGWLGLLRKRRAGTSPFLELQGGLKEGADSSRLIWDLQGKAFPQAKREKKTAFWSFALISTSSKEINVIISLMKSCCVKALSALFQLHQTGYPWIEALFASTSRRKSWTFFFFFSFPLKRPVKVSYCSVQTSVWPPPPQCHVSNSTAGLLRWGV